MFVTLVEQHGHRRGRPFLRARHQSPRLRARRNSDAELAADIGFGFDTFAAALHAQRRIAQRPAILVGHRAGKTGPRRHLLLAGGSGDLRSRGLAVELAMKTVGRRVVPRLRGIIEIPQPGETILAAAEPAEHVGTNFLLRALRHPDAHFIHLPGDNVGVPD